MKNEEGKRQKAQAPPTTQAAPLAAQSQIANRKSQIYSWLLAMLLVLGTVALYWPTTRCGFVSLDDNVNVTSNVHVQNGLTWESIKWAFLNPMATLWQPLTMLSHMAICQVFGLNPWGHHLANVLLHALNAGLVFALLRRMTGSTWRSLMVAALFTVHPLRVEAVAWVTERRDVLSGCFGLLALIAYACYAQSSREEAESRNQQPVATTTTHHAPRTTYHATLFYLLSLLFLALGLMSKPMLVTWPFVMLLLDYWPLKRMQNAEASDTLHAPRSTHHAPALAAQSQITNRQSQIFFPLLAEKLPFLALAVATSIVTFVVQKREGILSVGESLPLSVRLGNALISYCRYLGMLFWPTDLAVFYPHPGHWPLGKVLLAGGLILGISVLVWVQRQRYPYLLMGWLWYCGTLAPVSQIIQTGAHAMADRWTYLPSLGVLIMAVWGACELVQGKAEGRRKNAECRMQNSEASDTHHAPRTRVKSQIVNRKSQILLWLSGGAAIVLCMAVTRHQIGYWKNSELLLRHALAVTENNWLAHRNLAGELYDRGQLDEAISHFQEFVHLRPDAANSHYNLGIALYKKGQLDEAIRQLQEATRLDPEDAAAQFNLGTAFYQQGRTDEAIRQFQETIRLEPDHAQAHNNLGVALGMKGQTDEAIRQFQEALRLKPDYAEARRNLDTVLGSKAGSSPLPGTPP